MKIYCSNRNKDLDYFIGKDLWVKVKITQLYDYDENKSLVGFQNNPIYWIRVLGYLAPSEGSDVLYFNCILESVLPCYTMFTEDPYSILNTKKFYARKRDMKIIEPIDALTLDELLEVINNGPETDYDEDY